VCGLVRVFLNKAPKWDYFKPTGTRWWMYVSAGLSTGRFVLHKSREASLLPNVSCNQPQPFCCLGLYLEPVCFGRFTFTSYLQVSKQIGSTREEYMQELVLPLLSLTPPRKHWRTTVTRTPTRTEGNDQADDSTKRIPPVEEFLARFDEQASSCLENAYL
jgi:hypothetical protein